MPGANGGCCVCLELDIGKRLHGTCALDIAGKDDLETRLKLTAFASTFCRLYVCRN